MQILILNWRDSSHPRAGGSEVYAQHLARVWATNHEVTYFSSAVNGSPSDETVDGYRLVRAGHRFSVYREARKFFERSAHFDAVLDIINTRPFLAPQWAQGTPVVGLAYQVAREVWRYEVPFPAWVLGRYVLEPRWLRMYIHTPVLTISSSSAASLRAYGLEDVRKVPVGSESISLAAAPSKERAPTVIWVGRLASNKRPDHAVEAFSYVRSVIPTARLWIVGDGPMSSRLRRSSLDGVEMLGRVSQEEKYTLMARAHLLTATSVREGWGMTVSEAAALGTRAVTYDVPGLRDSVTSAGGRLAHPNPTSLGGALVDALQSSYWRTPPDRTGVVPWEIVARDVLAQLIAERDRLSGATFAGQPDSSYGR